eukprot:2409970-Pyramimonas_sp.AAC.2
MRDEDFEAEKSFFYRREKDVIEIRDNLLPAAADHFDAELEKSRVCEEALAAVDEGVGRCQVEKDRAEAAATAALARLREQRHVLNSLQ